MTPSIRKSIIMIIQRAQKEVVLTTGSFGYLSIALFGEVSNSDFEVRMTPFVRKVSPQLFSELRHK